MDEKTKKYYIELQNKMKEKIIQESNERLKELIKIKEENKTLKECLFQVQEASKHLVKALETRDKEVRVLKSNRLNMFEHLEIVQENEKLKKALEKIRILAITHDDGNLKFCIECEECSVKAREYDEEIIEIVDKLQLIERNNNK